MLTVFFVVVLIVHLPNLYPCVFLCLLNKRITRLLFTSPLENRWNCTIFQDDLLPFSIFADSVMLLAKVLRADTCVFCTGKILSLVSANFANPPVYLAFLFGKTMKFRFLFFLEVALPKWNKAIMRHL